MNTRLDEIVQQTLMHETITILLSPALTSNS